MFCSAQRFVETVTSHTMAFLVKFASMPVKYAPKRKTVNFSLPKWRHKLGELEDQDVSSFINNLYQDRIFKTRKEFNDAYDNRLLDLLHWGNKPMILTREDVAVFETTHKNGAFDTTNPVIIDKILTKMKAHLETGEKILFVY